MRPARFVFPLFMHSMLAQAPPPTPTFANTVRPFLETNCQSCHNGKARSGDVNFEVLKYANGVALPVIWPPLNP